MWTQRIRAARGDDGVALVAAMGVALVGIAVAAVVITQTIVAVNDSGRDRLRTAEVHAAEAAIDATMAQLEIASPCAIGPFTYGSGTQKANVEIDLDYYVDSTAVSCSDGTFSDSPNRAVVSATSTGEVDSVGLDPERTVQVSLGLTPRVSVSDNAAIYSTSNLTTSTGLQLSPEIAGQNADVWIDQGSWTCNYPSTITGSLIIPDGGYSITASGGKCAITGDLWVENEVYVSGGTAGFINVGGDATIRSGGVRNTGPFNVGGSITAGGSLQNGSSSGWSGHPVTSGGTQSYDVGAANITDIEPVGIPYIDYDFSDWQSLGFVEKQEEDLLAELKSQWNISADQTWRSGPLASCQYQGWISEGRPLKFSTVNSVYDLRDCSTTLLNNDLTVELYADTALFVTNFSSTGTITIKSGDGDDHKLWIISPQSGGGHVPGTIESSPQMTVLDGIETFWYSPKTVTFKSASQINGQIYGGTVYMASPVLFTYTNVGVPGVSLVSAAQTQNGFVVELLYKREVTG
ncbi:hypothetical protein [Demequina sp. NBRC 110057]|uniref:hypothetical protein n=1 Tax=Demequina sp. NBRC 110057 TaxID=1570346 RepID=UPI000A0479C9|nr:hypothetical protein [Demequina sp. NBRC 110057]